MGITESISNGRSHAMENYVDFNGVSKRNASGQDTQKNKVVYIVTATALGLVAVYFLFKRK